MTEEITVRIVDDDAELCRSLSYMIQSIGLQVVTYESAQQFLENDSPAIPGCVVLDVRMRGMSGLDLQDVLRERGNALPVIMITAHANVPMAVRALQSGAVHFIEKPFRDQELLDHVQNAIQLDLDNRKWVAEKNQVAELAATLTPRETQVMKLVVEGMSNKVIAHSLGVSFKTVEAHRAKVMRKMDAKSISQLIHKNLLLDPAQIDLPLASPSAGEEANNNS